MRILLHRGFLKLVTLNKEQGLSDAIAPATKCVRLACELIETITASMNTGGSGTLQAAVFSALGYLWNATITILLYLLSQRAHKHLSLGHDYPRTASGLVESAAHFFTHYQVIVPFAEAAARKSKRFLEKVAARTDQPPSHAFEQSNDVPFEDPNELFETFLMLDAPLSSITSNAADMDPQQYDLLQQHFDMPEWTNEGESYSFDIPGS